MPVLEPFHGKLTRGALDDEGRVVWLRMIWLYPQNR